MQNVEELQSLLQTADKAMSTLQEENKKLKQSESNLRSLEVKYSEALTVQKNQNKQLLQVLVTVLNVLFSSSFLPGTCFQRRGNTLYAD